MNDLHYKTLVLEYLKTYGKAQKKDIVTLLLDKLPDVLDKQEKLNKVRNLLQSMSKKDESIERKGTSQKGYWQLKTS